MAYWVKTAYWTNASNFTSFQNLSKTSLKGYYFTDTKSKKKESKSGRSDNKWFLKSRRHINKWKWLDGLKKIEGKAKKNSWKAQELAAPGTSRSGSKRSDWNKQDCLKAEWEATGSPKPSPSVPLGDCPSPTIAGIYIFIPWKGFLDWGVSPDTGKGYHYWK